MLPKVTQDVKTTSSQKKAQPAACQSVASASPWDSLLSLLHNEVTESLCHCHAYLSTHGDTSTFYNRFEGGGQGHVP